MSRLEDAMNDHAISKQEESFGEEMSAKEVADIFGEKDIPDENKNPLTGMSPSEAVEREAKQINSTTDIYRIKARVQNLISENVPGASMNRAGEVLCNTVVNMVKDLYDFANGLKDQKIKEELIIKIRKYEEMPANIIGILTPSKGK